MGVRNRPVDPNRVDLLTLAMVPVTRDGELIFVRRSSLTGSHQGSFGPAVSGNLELRSRPGVDVDRDRFGVPDPLSALVREAREELGLVVDRGRVFTTGLMTFSNPTEKGTRLLAATTLLDQSLVNIVDGLRAADLIEGRWEVGSSFLAALIPDNRVDLLQLASWLINSDELTPQATAAALASLMVLRDVGDVTSIPITGDVRRPDCVREVST
jgi:hypothetical protein